MNLGYVILYVENVEQTVTFYEKAFGLACRFKHEECYAEMDTGPTTLSFAKEDFAKTHGFSFTKQRKNQTPPAFEVAFIVEDIEKSHQNALLNGATELSKPENKPWGQWVSYLKDCNGFTVELCTAMSR